MTMAGHQWGAQVTMRHLIEISLVLNILLYPVTAQTPPCFSTLGAINTAMQKELIRIQNGATPQNTYVYNLCSNTVFDASANSLEPVLSNAMFVCGGNGSRQNSCRISGGAEQVHIVDSLVTGYPLQALSFMGITFSTFQSNTMNTGTSISAFASSSTTATFTDCAWQNFSSDFVILQNSSGNVFGPMTVQVKQSAVASGSTGSVFDNDGGLLRVSETDVSNVTASALIATANNGASFLELSTVSFSDMNSITFSTAGGSQSVMNTTVGKMIHMEDAFYVEGVGSTLLVDGTFVQNNTNQTVPWRVVSVRTEAIARVSASSISDNTAVEFGVVAFNSTVSIEDSFISRNSGSASKGTTSAPVFAITDAIVNLNSVELSNNLDFSGAVVALIRSTININKCCFLGGAAQFVVFIANDAHYAQSENFINNFSSQRCEATGPRLFQENAASGCFLGSSTCEGTCQVVADQVDCRANVLPTNAPSTQPPTVVTTSPTMTPRSASTLVPTLSPHATVSVSPTEAPSTNPSSIPTPSNMTQPPMQMPTPNSTQTPASLRPSQVPTYNTTISPAPSVTYAPSLNPNGSARPTVRTSPSQLPSNVPTLRPTKTNGKGKKKSKSKSKGSKGKKKSKSKTKGKGKSVVSTAPSQLPSKVLTLRPTTAKSANKKKSKSQKKGKTKNKTTKGKGKEEKNKKSHTTASGNAVKSSRPSLAPTNYGNNGKNTKDNFSNRQEVKRTTRNRLDVSRAWRKSTDLNKGSVGNDGKNTTQKSEAA